MHVRQSHEMIGTMITTIVTEVVTTVIWTLQRLKSLTYLITYTA